ncbi:MAG: AbrB/MazE/SpoVT family DNA-binding domain-containing protein [Acidobacteriota bacterium]
MKTTIDKAGRVVIPAPIRSRMGLRAGMELEVEVRDLSIRLVRAVPRPKIVRRNNRLVARPTVPPEQRAPMDISFLIKEERDRWPW